MYTHNAHEHGIGCQAICTPYIYGDKHKSTCKDIENSPPTLYEGGSLRLPIKTVLVNYY